jgi:uncharacterized protein (DUF4415 family)
MKKKRATDALQTHSELPPPRVDRERLAATTDEDIRRQIAEDPDTAPELDDAWFARARVVEPVLKGIAISLRVPPDVLEWYKAQGPRYQTRMNEVLRAYKEHHEGSTRRRRA